MALRDHEERQLAEIEAHLVDDDPGLAATFDKLETSHNSRFTSMLALILGVLCLYVVGLVFLVVGVTLASTFVIICGALLCAVPVLIGWRVWRSRRS